MWCWWWWYTHFQICPKIGKYIKVGQSCSQVVVHVAYFFTFSFLKSVWLHIFILSFIHANRWWRSLGPVTQQVVTYPTDWSSDMRGCYIHRWLVPRQQLVRYSTVSSRNTAGCYISHWLVEEHRMWFHLLLINPVIQQVATYPTNWFSDTADCHMSCCLSQQVVAYPSNWSSSTADRYISYWTVNWHNRLLHILLLRLVT